MEGTAMEYAMEVILKKEMRAEEQRCQRRQQVYARIVLTISIILLLGLSIKNLMLIHVFANEATAAVWASGKQDTELSGIENQSDEISAIIPQSKSGDTDSAVMSAFSQPHYTSILIENGDSLWSIASRYASMTHMDVREYVEELKRINRLTTDRIHAGHYLIVVYYE